MTDRRFATELSLDALPDAVWRAFADPSEVVRWFPLQAEAEPREGGRVTWAWDDTWSFRLRIARWEPGRRLRLVEVDRTDAAGEPVELAIDVELEGRGGGTLLRLVHSGFGPGSEWDDELDSISRGWRYELAILRHYLTRHHGRERHVAWVVQQTPLDAANAFARLTGPEGLGLAAEPPVPGGELSATTAVGDRISGTVLVRRPPFELGLVLASHDDGVLRAMVEGDRAVLALNLWGDHAEEVADFEARWRPRMAELLGPPRRP